MSKGYEMYIISYIYLCGFVLFFKLRMNARIDGKNKKQTAKAEPAALGTETKEEQN